MAGREAAARPLTGGEAAMARLLFGDAIDYAAVRVHAARFLPFGLQRDGVAMAPNGHLYFGAACCRADFSRESSASRRWFLHEMTHVWQHQLGYPVMLRGAFRIGLRYRYWLAPGRRLRDYDMEAQGEVLADYFALAFLHAPEAVRQRRPVAGLALYEQVLGDFLADPADPSNLPRSRLAVPAARALAAARSWLRRA